MVMSRLEQLQKNNDELVMKIEKQLNDILNLIGELKNAN